MFTRRDQSLPSLAHCCEPRSSIATISSDGEDEVFLYGRVRDERPLMKGFRWLINLLWTFCCELRGTVCDCDPAKVDEVIIRIVPFDVILYGGALRIRRRVFDWRVWILLTLKTLAALQKFDAAWLCGLNKSPTCIILYHVNYEYGFVLIMRIV